MEWHPEEMKTLMPQTEDDLSEYEDSGSSESESGITQGSIYEGGTILSFENPNYNLDSSRLADALNSNSNRSTTTTTTNSILHDPQLDGGLQALDTLYSELDHVCQLNRSSSVRNRRHYAQLDAGSMGVDVTTGPVTNLDQADHQNNSLVNNDNTMGRKQGSYTISHPDLIEQHVHQRIITDTNNHDSSSREYSSKHYKSSGVCEDSGVIADEVSSSSDSLQQGGRQSPPTHMTPYNTQDIYASPNKRVSEQSTDSSDKDLPLETHNHETPDTQPNNDENLPPGWERHEDNDGPYYWHIKSGTITRTPPERDDTSSNGSETQTTAAPPTEHPPVVMRQKKQHPEPEQMSGNMGGSVTRSNTSSALSELSDPRPRSSALDNAHKRRSYPARSDFTNECSGGRPIRFAVRSLGWVEIAEEDLTPERSSKAVNRCIVDLSVGRRDVLDVVGCWGDGKDLFMDLDEGSLKLVDPENLTVLNTQPIHTIRVWGVGRDNGRDFAYVARDKVSRKHMCHVFRCDTPARTIANTLRDICKKIMIERSLHQNINKPLDAGLSSSMGGSISLSNNNNTMSNNNNNNNSSTGLGGRLTRPTNLPTEHRRIHRNSQIIVPPQSFPTPMEEPKKVMRVQYVGLIQVDQPSGMDVVNQAIADLTASNPGPWKNVTVAVAPSTVTITGIDDGKMLAECRVRFLSFLGIGSNVKHCAFIMHNAQDRFVAYVFHCEPSTGALCKTIEAACKLRYQKCLDAHGGGAGRSMSGGNGSPRSISSSLRSIFTSITGGRKARSAES